MITLMQAESLLRDFEQEVQRVGYDVADKRALTNLFGYLKIRCADHTIYGSTDKLKAVEALERRWQQDRIGSPIRADYGEGILGWDANGTGRGVLTIGAILRDLRTLLVELPEKIVKPEPQIWPAMLASGVRADTITDAVDHAVAKALATRDAQQKVTAGV